MAATTNQRRSKSLAWALGVAITIVCLAGAPLLAERLPVKTYTVADGLQRDTVYRIRLDSRGFLWFCTAEGISRFDGSGMTNFTVADGLPNRSANDFLETKSGAVYIATGKGLARLNPHGLRGSKENPLFTTFLPDNPKAERILTLFEDKNSQVWVGTSDGLFKLIDAGGQIRFELVPLGKPLYETISVNEIIEDRRDALWIATADNGLLRLAAGADARRFTMDDKLPSNNVVSLHEDRDGQIWAGFRPGMDGGLCLLDGAAVDAPVKKCYALKDGLPSLWVPDLLQTTDGKIWIATVSGLCEWRGEASSSVCKTYTEKNDTCGSALSLAEDKDGNLWTGSECGAKRIARYGFTSYFEGDGLGAANTNSIFENAAGELFVSTIPTPGKERAVSRFDGDKFALVKPRLPEHIIWSGWGWQQTVWQDNRGAWWIPTGSGLFRSPDNTDFESLARAPLESVETGRQVIMTGDVRKKLVAVYGELFASRVKLYEVFRLFEDSRGDIWIVIANNELRRWDRTANRWHDHTAALNLSPDRVISAFAEDRNSDIWIGTGSDHATESHQGALVRYRDGQFRVFTHADGAPRGWVRDLYFDSRGRLWIATTQDGLMRVDNPSANYFASFTYSPANGLTSPATASVVEDTYGRIYVGTWRGVDRLNPDTGQVENFTAVDGLPGSFVETSYRDRHGNLWFAANHGLARFVPEPVRQRKPPNILITGLRVDGVPQTVSILGETAIPNLELGSNQRQVSVDFLGLGASLGEKLKYEYRLGNSDWTPAAERTVNFANLSPGAYRFEVRAVTADRLVSTAPATLSFRIAAPIWQRAWFVGLLALAVGLTAYALYRYRVARLLEVANMRTRIATDLHDDIGANLTKISILSEVARQQSGNGAESPLASIARISRESVSAMSEIIWAIDPERDTLLDLVRKMRQHAEETFTPRDIELRFNTLDTTLDLKLGVDVRRDFFLVFKEAVNNAARHSGCTRAEVILRVEGSLLLLTVTDNGEGFDATREAGGESEGYGLGSMRRRAAAMGGALTIESRPGEGTTVNLTVPMATSTRFSRRHAARHYPDR